MISVYAYRPHTHNIEYMGSFSIRKSNNEAKYKTIKLKNVCVCVNVWCLIVKLRISGISIPIEIYFKLVCLIKSSVQILSLHIIEYPNVTPSTPLKLLKVIFLCNKIKCYQFSHHRTPNSTIFYSSENEKFTKNLK